MREAEGGMNGRKALTQNTFCLSDAFLSLPSQDFVKAIRFKTRTLTRKLFACDKYSINRYVMLYEAKQKKKTSCFPEENIMLTESISVVIFLATFFVVN